MPRGIPNDPTKRKGAAQPAASQARVPEQPGQIPAEGYTLPDALKGQRGADLLLDACNLYGVNPDSSLPFYAGRGSGPFKELMSWKFYPGQPAAGIPDSVTFVTVAGLKIRYWADPNMPMDPDTEARLRNLFNAFGKDKEGNVIPLPLPDDLTLPRAAVSSVVNPNAGHQYRGGYLRRSQATDAART